MSFTVTPETLNTSAAKYRKALIIAMLLGIAESVKHMTVRPGIRYRETVGELAGDIELKPYTGAMPAGLSSATIKGRTLETFLGQVYELFHLRDLVSTIYGMDMTAKKTVDKFDINKSMLFYIVDQASGKLNLNLFKAIRNAGGNTTVDLFNGFDTITAADITATNISLVNGNLHTITGAITSADALDKLKAFYRASSDELQSIPTKMFLPFATYNMYSDDYQATVGAAPYNKEFNKTFLEGSNNLCELVPLTGKKDSPFIHLTTKSNMLVGVDQMSDLETVRVKEDNNVNWTQFILNMFFGTQFETINSKRFIAANIV